MRPVIRGRHAAVASMKAEATEAARQILAMGGNAFDAAVGGQAALGGHRLLPQRRWAATPSFSSITRATRRSIPSTPNRARPSWQPSSWYEKNNGGKIPESDGLLSGGLPGVVDAWYTLLDRWGTMSFEQVLQPAIDLAENGFPLSEYGASYIAESKKILKYPTTVKIYLPNGRPPKAGEILRNPDLARTLKKLVEAEKANHAKGRHEALKAARDRFYKGDIAKDLAAFSEANGGLFRYEDFAEYTAEVETPVSINYRGYQIYKNPSASQGPTELIALNLLEGYDLKALGHNSPDFLHTSVEAVKLAMADREKYLGDMDFIKIPYDGLLSKDYARERRKLIDPAKASLELRPGAPEKFTRGRLRAGPPGARGPRRAMPATTAIPATSQSSTRITTWSASSPACTVCLALASSWETLASSSTAAATITRWSAARPTRLEPGKRPRSTLQSTLIMKDGQPYAILGSPGGDDQVMRTMQTLINMIDFGMNIQQAIEAPRWSSRAFPASPFPHTMYPGDMSVEERIPESTRQALIARGHKLHVAPPWSLGSNAGIIVDVNTGVLSAGADPRVDAYAWAW